MKKKQQPLPEPEPQQRVETYALSSGIVTILPNESRAGLVKIETDLNNEFKPNTPHERFLVDRAISARWKVLRFRRLEAKLAEEYAESDAADDSSVLDTLEQSGNLYEKLDRMIASAERTGAAAIRELTQYRANALKVGKQSQIAEKQNKAKQADQWLRDELARIEQRPLPPFPYEFQDPAEPAEQNEPDFDPGDTAPES